MSPSLSIRLLLTQSDARLLALARTGNERAFEALVQRYRRPLLNYCRRVLLPDERAEDALQQALLQAWLALERGVEVADAKAWLYRIVHNAALNTLRVSGYNYCKLNETLSGADAPQADLDRRIAVREALAGLAALPEMQREALLRTAVEGHSHVRVARDLGVSENALRGLVYRARATLRGAATALTPTPLLSWMSSSANRGAPLAERLVEMSAAGGSASMASVAWRCGALAMTAGALAAGIGASHVPLHGSREHRAAHETTSAHSPPTLSAAVMSTQAVKEISSNHVDPSLRSAAHHTAKSRRDNSPNGESPERSQRDRAQSPIVVIHEQAPLSAPALSHDQPAASPKGGNPTSDGAHQGKATSSPGESSKDSGNSKDSDSSKGGDASDGGASGPGSPRGGPSEPDSSENGSNGPGPSDDGPHEGANEDHSSGKGPSSTEDGSPSGGKDASDDGGHISPTPVPLDEAEGNAKASDGRGSSRTQDAQPSAR